MSNDLTTQEMRNLYAAHQEIGSLRAQAIEADEAIQYWKKSCAQLSDALAMEKEIRADTERKLREAQERADKAEAEAEKLEYWMERCERLVKRNDELRERLADLATEALNTKAKEE